MIIIKVERNIYGMMSQMREIILDTETTGLKIEEGHRIIEIGCVELINKEFTGNTYHTYINPERDIALQAFEVHGLSREFLLDKPKFRDIKHDFLKFIAGDKIVAHNAWFDIKFLNHELKLSDEVSITNDRVIDTLIMARQKFPGFAANLDALCDRFMIDRTSRTNHGALIDAELLAKVYVILASGSRQNKIDLNTIKITQKTAAERAVQPPRQFQVSLEELNEHNALLGRISNALWNDLKWE